MHVHLRTRGTDIDYRFIGDTPKTFWWSEYKRRGLTDHEKPVIVVESDGAGWRVYLHGAESRRRDNRTTPITFSIVLASGDPEHGDRDDAADREFAFRLINLWLEAVSEPSSRSTVAERLDEVLPATTVDHWLASGVDPESARAAEKAVRMAFSSGLSEPEPPIAVSTSEPPHRRWLGDLSDDKSRETFVAHVRELLDGRQGKALILTFVQAPDDPVVADLAAAETGDLALLAARRGRTPVEGMHPLGKAEPVLPADGKDLRSRRPRPMGRKRLPLVALAVVILLVGLIAWLMLTGTGNATPLPALSAAATTITSCPTSKIFPDMTPGEQPERPTSDPRAHRPWSCSASTAAAR